MKLFKFDYAGNKGDNVITVPTDSQFLIGIGNGDQQAEAQLFDGATEILPEDAKIGEYTCFRMETQGTQFRKPYKAVISGNNFEDKSLWVIWFDEVDYKGYTSIGLGLPESINPENLNYDSESRLASFKAYVYGVDWSTDKPVFHYLETITLTWNASKTAYEVPEDFGNNMVKYIQFADCTESYIYFGYGWETATEGDGEGDAETSVPSPIPYTQNIDLFIICKKMSVAYRDENMSPEAAVEAVKESGEFVGKNESGEYEVIGNFSIIPGNGKTGVLVISGAAPDYVTGIELDMDEENERVNAYGTLFCADLIIKQPTFDKFLLISPNGNRWVVTVDNTGALGISAED